LLNAGAAIYTSGKVNSFKEGIEAAKQSIDSGNAFKKLEALKKCTNITK
jgi:anthranilate phosphoribosyltransferase